MNDKTRMTGASNLPNKDQKTFGTSIAPNASDISSHRRSPSDASVGEYGIEDDIYNTIIANHKGSKHPERYIIGKPHPDRAKQFKPFAALRGYEELVAKVMAKAAKSNDFSKFEESC